MKLEVHNHLARKSRQLPRSFALQVFAFCSLNFTSRFDQELTSTFLEHRIFLRGHCPTVRPQIFESHTGHVVMQLVKLCRKELHVEFTHLLRYPKFPPLEDLSFFTVTFSEAPFPSIYSLWRFIHVPSSKIILFGAFWWSLEVLSGLALGQIVPSPEYQCSC